VLSALPTSRLPRSRPEPTAARSGFFADTGASLACVAHHRVALAVALGLFLTVLFGALDNVARVFLAKSTFHAGATGFGLLASGYGIGMVLALLLLLRLSKVPPAVALLLGGLAGLAVGNLVTGLAPTLAIAVVAQAAAGAGNGLENIANDTLIQTTVPREVMGRVFGSVYTAAFLAEALAYAIGGPLLNITSARALFIIAGCGIAVSFVAVWLILVRHADPPPTGEILSRP
jgi:MFS family permease